MIFNIEHSLKKSSPPNKFYNEHFHNFFLTGWDKYKKWFNWNAAFWLVDSYLRYDDTQYIHLISRYNNNTQYIQVCFVSFWHFVAFYKSAANRCTCKLTFPPALLYMLVLHSWVNQIVNFCTSLWNSYFVFIIHPTRNIVCIYMQNYGKGIHMWL